MVAYLWFILFCLIFVHILFNYNKTARLLRKVPGPNLAFIIGNAFDLIVPRENLFQFLREFAKTWGTIWRFWSYPLGVVCIFHPNDVEVILSGIKHNKKSIFYNFLKPWLGDGLLVRDGAYVIPSGTYCVIHIYDLHRSEELYKDPHKFYPDRFLPENMTRRQPYAYIPFSAGPRNCIGQNFAMLEMKSVISEILRKFVLLPMTKTEDLDFTVDLVLRTAVPAYVSFVIRPDSF